jgi:hypothetical protein
VIEITHKDGWSSTVQSMLAVPVWQEIVDDVVVIPLRSMIVKMISGR